MRARSWISTNGQWVNQSCLYKKTSIRIPKDGTGRASEHVKVMGEWPLMGTQKFYVLSLYFALCLSSTWLFLLFHNKPVIWFKKKKKERERDRKTWKEGKKYSSLFCHRTHWWFSSINFLRYETLKKRWQQFWRMKQESLASIHAELA